MNPAFSYHNYNLNLLVSHLDQNALQQQTDKINRLQEQRKSYASSLQNTKKKIKFNNKIKQSILFDTSINLLPYKFIPKFKNQTFILPDRAHAKGNHAKRLKIKMKDTSLFSFSNQQDSTMKKYLHFQQKQSIIQGRKMQQLNRILDRDSAQTRISFLKTALFNTKKFCPTSTASQLFSKTYPVVFNRDKQNCLNKKVNLTKTLENSKQSSISYFNEFLGNTKEVQVFRNTLNDKLTLR